MAISITKADIKRKCRIPASDIAYDSDIDSLIAEMQPSIEYTIAETYIDDTANTRLQSILKLGILEILSGEFLQQLSREVGVSEAVTIGSITIGAAPDQGAKLIAQGTSRLLPFRKAIDGMSSEIGISSTTAQSDRIFTSGSMEVW
ncbi:MAG: hypothetical protein ACYC27_21900 [Armatimonadota bacterium]